MIRYRYTPCVLWRAAAGYDPRLVSVSGEGLKRIVHQHLVATGRFGRPGEAWVGEFRDTLPGHLHRAIFRKQPLDLSHVDFWELMKIRESLIPYTDGQTIRAIDRVAADFVFSTVVAPEVLLDESQPALSEWWIECEPLTSGAGAPMHYTVMSALHDRMVGHLSIPVGELEVVVLNHRGESGWTNDGSETFGTFVCRRTT